MSNSYHPDKWVVLVFSQADGVTYRKVFASWYGGFAGSDSWKLSSVIEHVEDIGDTLEFHCCSGSTYYCNKKSYGMSAYSTSVYNYWVSEVKTATMLGEVNDAQINISTDYTKE